MTDKRINLSITKVNDVNGQESSQTTISTSTDCPEEIAAVLKLAGIRLPVDDTATSTALVAPELSVEPEIDVDSEVSEPELVVEPTGDEELDIAGGSDLTVGMPLLDDEDGDESSDEDDDSNVGDMLAELIKLSNLSYTVKESVLIETANPSAKAIAYLHRVGRAFLDKASKPDQFHGLRDNDPKFVELNKLTRIGEDLMALGDPFSTPISRFDRDDLEFIAQKIGKPYNIFARQIGLKESTADLHSYLGTGFYEPMSKKQSMGDQPEVNNTGDNSMVDPDNDEKNLSVRTMKDHMDGIDKLATDKKKDLSEDEEITPSDNSYQEEEGSVTDLKIETNAYTVEKDQGGFVITNIETGKSAYVQGEDASNLNNDIENVFETTDENTSDEEFDQKLNTVLSAYDDVMSEALAQDSYHDGMKVKFKDQSQGDKTFVLHGINHDTNRAWIGNTSDEKLKYVSLSHIEPAKLEENLDLEEARVKDDLAMTVKELAIQFFKKKPYSSARIANGTVYRMSFPISSMQQYRYPGGATLANMDSKDSKKLKDIKNKFLGAVSNAGLDASLVDVKFHIGSGVYASIRVSIPLEEENAHKELKDVPSDHDTLERKNIEDSKHEDFLESLDIKPSKKYKPEFSETAEVFVNSDEERIGQIEENENGLWTVWHYDSDYESKPFASRKLAIDDLAKFEKENPSYNYPEGSVLFPESVLGESGDFDDVGDAYDIHDVRKAEHTLDPMQCKHCGSHEVVHQQAVNDAICQDCGQWQDGEEMDENAPPGMDRWIKKNKGAFRKEYGTEDGDKALYATAWKMHNEGVEQRESRLLREFSELSDVCLKCHQDPCVCEDPKKDSKEEHKEMDINEAAQGELKSSLQKGFVSLTDERDNPVATFPAHIKTDFVPDRFIHAPGWNRDKVNAWWKNYEDHLEMNENEEGKHGYVCFYKGKKIEVYANTSLEAQTKAAAQFKAKKSYEVNVVLAQKDGKDVTHVATESLNESSSFDGIEFHIQGDGSLSFTADDSGKEFLLGLLEDYNSGHKNWDQIWSEVIEPFQANGQLYMVSPEDIGALTDAPIVSDEFVHDDNGDVDHVGDIWYYSNYQTSDPIEVLANQGEVTFTKA